MVVRSRFLEFIVGVFLLAGLIGLAVLAFNVSGLTQIGNSNAYKLVAQFDNIGGLKVRAPVSLAGVRIGQVESITIDPKTFRASVEMLINKDINNLPIDTSASIFTQGLLGSNYISFTPGFEQKVLRPNDNIETTHSALILENLIGQLLYNLKGNNNNSSGANPSKQ